MLWFYNDLKCSKNIYITISLRCVLLILFNMSFRIKNTENCFILFTKIHEILIYYNK